MKSISIKEYAIKNKMSIYTVVKLTKNGTLKSETKKLGGKDEVFVFEEQEVQTRTAVNKGEKIEDFQKAYYSLKEKYEQLQLKYERLQKSLKT